MGLREMAFHSRQPPSTRAQKQPALRPSFLVGETPGRAIGTSLMQGDGAGSVVGRQALQQLAGQGATSLPPPSSEARGQSDIRQKRTLGLGFLGEWDVQGESVHSTVKSEVSR